MREDLNQNLVQELPNPIQKENQTKGSESSPETSSSKTPPFLKHLKNPKVLVLIILFSVIIVLFILSLFVNKPTQTSTTTPPTATPIPLNKPTSIPQIPEKYKDKFDSIDQDIQNIQVELPPAIDENIGQ